MNRLVEDLTRALVGSGAAVTLEAYPKAATFRFLHPDASEAQLEPLVQLGRDVWLWATPEALPAQQDAGGTGAAARILEALARRHPAQSLHVLMHPLTPWGRVRVWGLDSGSWGEDGLQPGAARLVLGQGPGEWEAVCRYLQELAARCELFGDLRQRGFWGEALASGSFRAWLTSAIQERVPAGQELATWMAAWTRLGNSGAFLSDSSWSLLEAGLPGTMAGQGEFRMLAKGWILNRPGPLKVRPLGGHEATEPPGALFRRAWRLEDFQGLAAHPDLHALVLAMTQVLPLTAAGVREAARQAPPIVAPWADHLVSTALRQVVWTAMERSPVHGLEAQDLFQEGLLAAMEAARSYERLGQEGEHRSFVKYSDPRIWRSVERYCLANRHLIRHPVTDHQEVGDPRAGALWALAPEGLSLSQRVVPILPLQADLRDPWGTTNLTVAEILTGGGVGGSMRPCAGPARVEDLVGPETSQGYGPLEGIRQRELRAGVRILLQSLREREEEVLRLRFGVADDPATVAEGRSYLEVGNLFELSKMRIRQIEAQAFKRLRDPRYRRFMKPLLALAEAAPAPPRGEFSFTQMVPRRRAPVPTPKQRRAHPQAVPARKP